MSISPWMDANSVPSPNGMHIARIENPMEIAMGGPAIGTLRLSNGFMLESCSPSMVWSDDSAHLAIPVWTHERMQKLAIVSVRSRSVAYAPGIYRVLQLESFNNGVICGIDSPIYMPQQVDIGVQELLEGL